MTQNICSIFWMWVRTGPVMSRMCILYCPIHDTSVILNEVSRLVLMIMGAMAGVSIVLFWFVAGKYFNSGEPLCEAARGIGEKKFKKVETGTNVKELYELENEINQMQDNLLKADEAERVFFQNASHELQNAAYVHQRLCPGDPVRGI